MGAHNRRLAGGKYVAYDTKRGQLNYGKDVPFLSTAGLWVIPSDPFAADNNDVNSPYLTVQGAIDALPVTGGTIFIAPGTYQEILIVNKSNVRLINLSGQRDVVIQPVVADMPAIVVASATTESINAWLAAGSANWLANIGMLVDVGNTATLISAFGIRFSGIVGTHGVVVASAGAFVAGAWFEQCAVSNGNRAEGFWTYQGLIYLQDCNELDDDVACEAHDASLAKLIRTKIGDLVVNDTSEVDGWDFSVGSMQLNNNALLGSNLALGRARRVDIRSDLEMNDDAIGVLYEVSITTDIVMNDDSILTVFSGFVGDRLTVGGDASIAFEDVHVQGINNFINAGGAVACTADGGAFTIAIVDPGVRLTRIVGF